LKRAKPDDSFNQWHISVPLGTFNAPAWMITGEKAADELSYQGVRLEKQL